MRTTVASIAGGLALILAVVAGADDRDGSGGNGGATTKPATTAPAAEPFVALLSGTYRGTVVDAEELVPCVTTFRLSGKQIVGTYAVREGAEAYPGTLDRYELLSEAKRECRFRWHDRNGEGYVTVTVTPDGSSFAGSWGLEYEQDRLVWRGKRAEDSAARTQAPSRRTGKE